MTLKGLFFCQCQSPPQQSFSSKVGTTFQPRIPSTDATVLPPYSNGWRTNCSHRALDGHDDVMTWRRECHLHETFFALLALCAGNSPVTGEFPTQRPVTRSFDVFFDLLNRRLSKQSWGWWFETPSCPLWRHCNFQHHVRRRVQLRNI